MADKAPQLGQFCACGARLQWEARSHGFEERWLALCESGACGKIAFARAAHDAPQDALRRCLVGAQPIRPYRPPWVRLFLESIRRDDQSWAPSPMACRECSEEQLVFELDARPLFDPYAVSLCLRCGAVSTRHT